MENSDYEKNFTSTGDKLFLHPEALKKFMEEGIATPIVLHIMPTSQCNLRCSFCSVKDRQIHENLNLEKTILPTVDKLKKRGLKSVILSGGGEPTLYPQFENMINGLKERNLEIGLITNGTLFSRYEPALFEKMEWIRVSINSLDYISDIKIPKLKHPTLGFSYIITEKDTTREGLAKIKKLANELNVSYVRLLPDCAQPLETLKQDHKKVGELAKELGEPFFHQYKVHKTPESCYLGYFHPVLYCDGNIYPCDSLVLNDFDNQQFHKEFMLCEANDIDKLYKEKVSSLVDTKKMCPNCVFERQNSLLQAVLEGKYSTIPKIEEIQHKNFI